MRFRLIYEGRLNSNGDNFHKWELRNQFEPQLRRLWTLPPLSDIQKYRDPAYQPNNLYVGIRRHNRVYVPLISSTLGLYGELDVLFLSTSKAGQVLYHGGDIDDRIKTLFDSLTVPDDNQVPPEKLSIPPGEFNCLLEDDKLVRRVSIENDQLLTDQTDPKRVVAIIGVSVKLARAHLEPV